MATCSSSPLVSSGACYTFAIRRARLDGLHVAAIAGAGSLVLYLTAYAFIAGTSVFNAPTFDIAVQAIVQGVLTAVVALLLYGRMVSVLGASVVTASFGARG